MQQPIGLAPVPHTAALSIGPALDHCQFTWTDPNPVTAMVTGFNVYLAASLGGPAVLLATIAAVPQQTNYGPTANLCASVPDGQKYATLRAVNAAGKESAPSDAAPFALVTSVPSAPVDVNVR
jgi:hypothetical protein